MKRPQKHEFEREVHDGADLAEWYQEYYQALEKYANFLEAKAAQHKTSAIGSFPADEEIAKWVKDHGYYGHCTSEYHEGLEEGAKWVRDLIRNVQ